MARTQRGARYGSGTLIRRAGPKGDTWIAKWRDGGRQVQRELGFVHSKQHPDGLTRAEAEVALGKLREHVAIERADERAAEAKRAAEERRRPLAQVGEALIAAKRAAGRKPSTIEAYSYWLLSQESRWKGDDDLVFAHPETGKPIDRSKLLKRFKAALARADVRAVRFHDLRHTFGTRMAAQGMPMRVLQELMGHRDFKTTLIYADYAPSEREAEWVEEAFRPAAQGVVNSPVGTRGPTKVPPGGPGPRGRAGLRGQSSS